MEARAALTLDTALTLAQDGQVTSISLTHACGVRPASAAEYLARYAARGYLVRLNVGRPWHPASYAITELGSARLNRLRHVAVMHVERREPNPFGPLLDAMSSPIAMGGTGFG